MYKRCIDNKIVKVGAVVVKYKGDILESNDVLGAHSIKIGTLMESELEVSE